MTVIGVLGLGEAGRIYAVGLVDAGATVRGFDPVAHVEHAGLTQTPTLADAVRDVDLVISLVGANAAESVATQALDAMTRGVFADFNTASPSTKRSIAATAAARSIPMADVAVLAPVPRAGAATALLLSGDGADAASAILRSFGAAASVIDGGAGDAARLKLLRSVFMKGLAALTIEGLTAAREVGAEDWMRAQIAGELGPDGDAFVQRLVEGTHQHAERRLHEMRDALDAAGDAGTPLDMTRATVAWLERIVRSSRPSR